MYNFLLLIFLFVAISLITLVMLQKGKACEVGATLKTRVSRIIFFYGVYGSFLTYMTTIFAVIFFILSLVLCTMSSNFSKKLEIKLDKYKQNKKIYLDM